MFKYLLGLLLLLVLQCPFTLKEVPITHVNSIAEYVFSEIGESDCNNTENYLPDTSLVNNYPTRYIRINIHFMNDSTGTLNYTGESGRKYARELIYYANHKLKNNKKMNLPEGNSTEVFFPGYQYILTPATDDPEDDGIYFHTDNELAYFVNEGRFRNNYSMDVSRKYAIGEDSILNVFYMIHHPDSVRSETYSASASGIALGKSLKLGTTYDPEIKPWYHASLLNHEVGHVLGLSHTWNLNDGCDDTPRNSNCWAPTNRPPCDGIISNNMMDYNSNQHAITPCQISIMRKNLSRENSRQRDLVEKRWCKLDSKKDILIDTEVYFNGSTDSHGNIHVLDEGTLVISCRLSMPENGEIIVYPGGNLILNGGRIHNDCGKNWGGIKLLKKGRNKGKIILIKWTDLDNLEHIPSIFQRSDTDTDTETDADADTDADTETKF